MLIKFSWKGILTMFNIVVFHSENEILLPEIKAECQRQNWVPVACLEIYNKKTILLFSSIDTARSFLRRNFNKNTFVGLVVLGENDVKNIKDNYDFEELNWPKKMNNIKFEIIELEHNPLLKVISS
jgi:hypothetical protein